MLRSSRGKDRFLETLSEACHDLAQGARIPDE